MGWQDEPFAGDVWRSRNPQETRHVIDRTYGGAVFYVSGRRYYWSPQTRCTEDEWNEWVSHAKLTTRIRTRAEG